MPIVVVHRSDGSGTSYIFTDFLSHVSPEWKSKVGDGQERLVAGPSAVGAKGNEGVAGQVRSTPGAIGYVELAYVVENHMPAAMLQNRAGKWVACSPETDCRGRGHEARSEPDELLDRRRGGCELVPDLGLLLGRWSTRSRRMPSRAKLALRRAVVARRPAGAGQRQVGRLRAAAAERAGRGRKPRSSRCSTDSPSSFDSSG